MWAVVPIVLVLVWTLGGFTALAYAGLLLLATLPGLPLGFRLFGPRHAAGWLTGAIAGYALSSLIIWAARAIRPSSDFTAMVGWACVSTIAWMLVGRAHSRVPWLTAPVWTERDRLALAVVLLLVPAIVGPPFARINARDDQGNVRMHAYFTADFVWHMAVVAELRKSAQPPRDPFLASQPLHYYWTYFLVPASGGRMTGASPQLALEINAIGASLTLVAAVFLAAWAAWPRHPLTVAAATAFTIIASSAEGSAALVYVFRMTGGLAGVRDLNVDALSRGLGGLRIDGLPRAMWYTPQHAASYAAGLTALPVAMWGGVLAAVPAILAAGTLLAFSAMLNPFIGAVFCAIYAGAVIVDGRAASRPSLVARHALAIVPVAAAIAWIAANRMIDGAGGALRFGFVEPASHAPISSFILSLGPVLALVIAGLWPRHHRPFRNVAPAALGMALGGALMHLLVLTVDLFWVGFRTGHLILVLAPAVVTRGLLLLRDRGRATVLATVGLLLVVGAPTTVIDTFNARDIDNAHMGPGFHWTVVIEPEEQAALAWIRAHTPETAVVQMEPVVRGRETWSLIPSYAERRMAAGLPISLMHIAEYDARSTQVQRIYGSGDTAAAWRIARALEIDFLYLAPIDRRAYPASRKLLTQPEYFTPVFRAGDVAVVAVNPVIESAP